MSYRFPLQGLAIFFALGLSFFESVSQAMEIPNVLFIIADDWGPHAGCYGTPWVKTPNVDRLAGEGLRFENAFTPMAKCAPSRAIILTGRHLWQNEEAGNHMAYFPSKLRTWPEVLRDNRWSVGITGKGWGPGIAKTADGKPRELVGKSYDKRRKVAATKQISNNDYAANFVDFLDETPSDLPWCFWCGFAEPHRAYEFQSGMKLGNKKTSDIDRVPAYWPDNETVRHDMLDYAFEVEQNDDQLGRILAELDKRNLAQNTIVILTSDHGMPFPRVKGYAYVDSNHIPLIIRWPNKIKKAGGTITDFVDFTDIAATVLDLANISAEQSMMLPITGKSWRPILESDADGQVIAERDHVLVGKERTDVGRPNNAGYPIRGIVTADFLFLKNYEPSRWPAGNPEMGYLDTDGSPTKTLIIDQGRASRDDKFWRWNFGMRPLEELYSLKENTDCVENLIASPDFVSSGKLLRERMENLLKSQGDPRMFGQGYLFDQYKPTTGDGMYEKKMAGEKVEAGWITATDVEPAPIEAPKP